MRKAAFVVVIVSLFAASLVGQDKSAPPADGEAELDRQMREIGAEMTRAVVNSKRTDYQDERWVLETLDLEDDQRRALEAGFVEIERTFEAVMDGLSADPDTAKAALPKIAPARARLQKVIEQTLTPDQLASFRRRVAGPAMGIRQFSRAVRSNVGVMDLSAEARDEIEAIIATFETRLKDLPLEMEDSAENGRKVGVVLVPAMRELSQGLSGVLTGAQRQELFEMMPMLKPENLERAEARLGE